MWWFSTCHQLICMNHERIITGWKSWITKFNTTKFSIRSLLCVFSLSLSLQTLIIMSLCFIWDTTFVEVKCNSSLIFFGRLIYLWEEVVRRVRSRKTHTHAVFPLRNGELLFSGDLRCEITTDSPVCFMFSLISDKSVFLLIFLTQNNICYSHSCISLHHAKHIL